MIILKNFRNVNRRDKVVSIVRRNRPEWCLHVLKSAVPSYDLVKSYLESKITLQQYLEIYKKSIDKKNLINEINNITKKHSKIYLCCDANFVELSHRKIIAELIKDEMEITLC